MTKKGKKRARALEPELVLIEDAGAGLPGAEAYVGLMGIWLGPPLAGPRAWLHAAAPVQSVEVLDRAYPRGSTARDHLLTLLEFYETVGALVRHGAVVCSRTKANWRSGIEYIRAAGGVLTNTETGLFQLLGVAGTPEFKAISNRIK